MSWQLGQNPPLQTPVAMAPSMKLRLPGSNLCSASGLGKLFNLCLNFLVCEIGVILLSPYYLSGTVLNKCLTR